MAGKKRRQIGVFKKILQFLTRESVILISIFVIALALRILHILTLSDLTPILDASDYNIYATRMLKGLGLGYPSAPAYKGPVYPLFLSVIYFLYGFKYQAARIAQAFLNSAACLLIYLLAKKLFSRRTGYTAAAIGALFTLFIFYSGFLLTETLFVFLITLFALNILNALNKPDMKNLIISGVILGITALTRADVLLTFVFVAFVFLINNKFKLLKTMKEAGIILAAALIIILPWTLRNYLVTDSFILISSQGGANFWIGNNPNANGMHMEVPPEIQDKYQLNKDLDKALTKEAVNFIRSDTKKWLSLCRRKFSLYFKWWIDESQWQFKERFRFVNDLSPPLIPLFVISILGVAGMILTIPYIKKVYLLYAFLLSNILLQIIIFVDPRFRMQIMPFLIIFAASPVYLIERFLERH